MSVSITEFFERINSKQRREARIAAWHMQAHIEGGLDLPYDPYSTFVSVNVWDNENGGYDAEKSLDKLAAVTKFASKQENTEIDKHYGTSDFELKITIFDEHGDNRITIEYYADRETVCTKKVVGKKWVEEKIIPGRYEDEIEWDCDPISLLARSTVDVADGEKPDFYGSADGDLIIPAADIDDLLA